MRLLWYHRHADWECDPDWDMTQDIPWLYSTLWHSLSKHARSAVPAPKHKRGPCFVVIAQSLAFWSTPVMLPWRQDGSFSLRHCRVRQSSSTGQRYTTRHTPENLRDLQHRQKHRLHCTFSFLVCLQFSCGLATKCLWPVPIKTLWIELDYWLPLKVSVNKRYVQEVELSDKDKTPV